MIAFESYRVKTIPLKANKKKLFMTSSRITSIMIICINGSRNATIIYRLLHTYFYCIAHLNGYKQQCRPRWLVLFQTENEIEKKQKQMHPQAMIKPNMKARSSIAERICVWKHAFGVDES